MTHQQSAAVDLIVSGEPMTGKELCKRSGYSDSVASYPGRVAGSSRVQTAVANRKQRSSDIAREIRAKSGALVLEELQAVERNPGLALTAFKVSEKLLKDRGQDMPEEVAESDHDSLGRLVLRATFNGARLAGAWPRDRLDRYVVALAQRLTGHIADTNAVTP